MSSYSLSSFQVHSSHLQNCQIDLNSNHRIFYTTATDDVVCQYQFNQNAPASQPIMYNLNNLTGHHLNSIALHPIQTNIYILGTKNGYVYCIDIQDSFLSHIEFPFTKILYKIIDQSSDSSIKQLKFTQNGQYLIIVTNQPYLIIYDWQSKRFYKEKLPQETEISTVSVDYKNQFISVIDFQGNVSLYSIQRQIIIYNRMEQKINQDYYDEDPFNTKINIIFKLSYKISSPNLFKKFKALTGSFNLPEQSQFLAQTLYLPGQKTLQKIQLNLPPAEFYGEYKLVPCVYCSKQILQVHFLKHQKGNLLLISTEIETMIRQEKSGQKLMIFNHREMFSSYNQILKKICIISQNNWKFAFNTKEINEDDRKANTNNKVYIFYGYKQLAIEMERAMKAAIGEQNIELIEELIEQKKQVKNLDLKYKEEKERSANFSLLIPKLPQNELFCGYEKTNNSRFLFYNKVGCIIERTDSIESESGYSCELQFHDRSKISRIKINNQGKYQLFTLCEDTLVSASSTLMEVQSEKYLKDNFIWEYEWDGILGVAIGGQWIAALNQSEFKIFSWVGNQLFSVAFDRKYVTMAAYENQLAIVYHSALPMWGVQSFKIMIFQIDDKSIKYLKDIILPIKPNNYIKWFGYSQQGMLICQDDVENIRVYNNEKGEWMLTLSLDSYRQKIFIQHVQNYCIYGFRLNQKFPNEPRVLPRSLPTKIDFELSSFKIDYLGQGELIQIKKHKLNLLWLSHQKYRALLWYKYKYSRNRENRWYSRSITIKSEEQIKALQVQYDLKIIDYLNKFIRINTSGNQNHDQNLWNNVLNLCNSLVFYKETSDKLFYILSASRIRNIPKQIIQAYSSSLQSFEMLHNKKININQLDRLEQMMGLKWVDQTIQQMNRFQQEKSIESDYN